MTAPTEANGAAQAEPEHPVFAFPVHPLAAAFPMMGEAELDDLAADIKKNGLHNPVTVDEEGRLLDGRNRLEGCRRASVRPKVSVFGGDDAEAVRFIFSVNFHRRHLDNEGKITAIKKVLELYPDFSDRAIARLVGASPTTVGKVRAATEPLMSTDGHKPRTEASGRKARGVKPGAKPAASTPAPPPPSSPTAPAGQKRAQAIVDFAALLHRNLLYTLEDLVKLLQDEAPHIAEITPARRAALARGYLGALGVTVADLSPIPVTAKPEPEFDTSIEERLRARMAEPPATDNPEVEVW